MYQFPSTLMLKTNSCSTKLSKYSLQFTIFRQAYREIIQRSNAIV